MNSQNKLIIAGAVLSFLAMCIFSILTYSGASEKIFGLETFYQSDFGSGVNPREQYNSIYKNTFVSNVSCLIKMREARHPMQAGSYTWVVDGKGIMDESDLKSILAEEGDYTILKPYTSDGQAIISPSELVFINANTLQESEDTICIEAYMGTDYVIRFDNVKTWWCHIGKENQNRHTEVIGVDGIYSKCMQGYIIGEALKNTTVSLYKVDANGRRTPCKFTEVFLPE